MAKKSGQVNPKHYVKCFEWILLVLLHNFAVSLHNPGLVIIRDMIPVNDESILVEGEVFG